MDGGTNSEDRSPNAPESLEKKLSWSNTDKDQEIPKNWEGVGDYMRVKRIKLQQQFQNMGESVSSILQGVSVYINGYTDPPDAELKALVRAHGGNYEYMYSASKVTHIIANNMADTKIKKLANALVVTPKWIVDSVEAGVQLPTESYKLYGKRPANQKPLFFPTGTAGKETVANPLCGRMVERAGEGTEQDVDHSDTICGASSGGPSHFRAGENFVTQFYRYSRLHHLSTWASELKDYVSSAVEQKGDDAPLTLPVASSLRGRRQTAVVHIDLDCFFVSVSIRGLPGLKGKPVAVTHAKMQRGESATHQDSMSDIASCSYEARRLGVHNGMCVGAALRLCPDLVTVPYKFEEYYEVSRMFYDILLAHTMHVEAVSCDEAYIELSDYTSSMAEVEDKILSIRCEIEKKTGCTVSAGIAPNMLLARMATRTAKPNGQYLVRSEDIATFLSSQPVRDLPGVGYATAKKLDEKGISNCEDLKAISLSVLQTWCGSKTGQVLYNYARGLDDRELKTSKERKSISAEINFGIRLSTMDDAESLVGDLAAEVEKRAHSSKVQGTLVTLKMKVRSKDAAVSTRKYLGHGVCDNLSRSSSLRKASRSAADLKIACVTLLRQMRPPAEDIRGMGIQLSKLSSDSKDHQKGSIVQMVAKMKQGRNTTIQGGSTIGEPMRSGVVSLPKLEVQSADASYMEAVESRSEHHKGHLPEATSMDVNESFFEDLYIPPLCQLDSETLAGLPSEMREKILSLSHGTATKEQIGQGGPTPEASSAQNQLTASTSCVETVGVTASIPHRGSAPCVQLSEMKEYINVWLSKSSAIGPCQRDLDSFASYLNRVSADNLEGVFALLMYLRRSIVCYRIASWHSGFNHLLAFLNEQITDQFGGPLKVNIL